MRSVGNTGSGEPPPGARGERHEPGAYTTPAPPADPARERRTSRAALLTEYQRRRLMGRAR